MVFPKKTDILGKEFFLYEVNRDDNLLNLKTFIMKAKNSPYKFFVISAAENHLKIIKDEVNKSNAENIKVIELQYYNGETFPICAETYKITPEIEEIFELFNKATGNSFHNSVRNEQNLFDGFVSLLKIVKEKGYLD